MVGILAEKLKCHTLWGMYDIFRRPIFQVSKGRLLLYKCFEYG